MTHSLLYLLPRGSASSCVCPRYYGFPASTPTPGIVGKRYRANGMSRAPLGSKAASMSTHKVAA